MTSPNRPQVPPQPAPVVKPPEAAPQRINVGIRTILNQLAEPDTATRGAKSALTAEHEKHLDRIAKLAKQLREELDALAKLEPDNK
jgi:hypothetical protein